MNNKIRALFFSCLGLLFGISVMYIYRNFVSDAADKNQQYITSKEYIEKSSPSDLQDNQNIGYLTEENRVIRFVKQNHKLPEYYITKNEAKDLGWNPSKGNLCEIAEGRAIGGDLFKNREKRLPENVKYYEADVNCSCIKRNGDRIVFTKSGDVYLTKNHYQSFEKK